MAPFDRLLAAAPLPARVLALRQALRLLLALSTVTLLWIGSRRLAYRLGLQGPMEAAALFVSFSCQMIYGTTCHIANDALMLPWLVFFLASVTDACGSALVRHALITGLLMAIGLLIKASLLVFVPLVFVAPALLIIRQGSLKAALRLASVSAGMLLALAGPWYFRNVILYHNLTATNDTTAGIGVGELLRAAASLPWRESIAASAHSALWTGNSSFTNFSASTLNIVLALLGVAAVSYAYRARRSAPELVTLAAIALYSAGLVLIALSFFHATQGQTNAPMPWYMQVLLAPVVAICFLGLARWPTWGKWIAIVTVLLWAYVALASWFAKLVPMYAGFADAHAHVRQLLAWYLDSSAQRDAILSTICPAPLGMLYILLAALLALLLACTVATCFSLSQSSD